MQTVHEKSFIVLVEGVKVRVEMFEEKEWELEI